MAVDDPEIELYGRWAGMVVGYNFPGAGGVCGRWEVRLTTIAGQARQLAAQTCGLNGQGYVGVSFAAGRLYFARYCVADPEGCGRGAYGAFRYALGAGDHGLARFGRRLTGFAIAGAGRAHEVRAADTSSGYCGNSLQDEPQPPCQVVLANIPRFAPTRAPR
jgi:hypothetical protein